MNWTDLLTDAVEDNYRATDILMAMGEAADLDWKPASGSNWMTTGQLLWHLTSACGYCCRCFLTGEWGPPDGVEAPEGSTPEDDMLPPAEGLPTIESVQKARELLAADKQVALDAIAEAGEDKLAGETVAAPWDPEHPALYGRQFLGMVIHLQSHKSQLFYYLKLLGRDVNTMTLWGM